MDSFLFFLVKRKGDPGFYHATLFVADDKHTYTAYAQFLLASYIISDCITYYARVSNLVRI